MKAAAHHRRRQRRQLGLHRLPKRTRKPLRRLHDDVKQILAPRQSQLRALLIEVADGLLDFQPRGVAHIVAIVQHPIHRHFTQPALLSDLMDLVAVSDPALLMGK